MIHQLVNRFMIRRHYWRDVQFNELSELYTSMLLRSLASNVLFVFIPIFMYQNGYSVAAIFMMYGLYFAFRAPSDIAGGYIVARIGPKHTQIISCVLQIISAAQFMTIPQFHWSIIQLGAVWGASASLYFIAYHVEFSKVKHTVHAGKELGYMQIMDKIGGLAGPIFGGVVGVLVGSQFIFGAAALMLIASLWPLFRTSEPTKTRQKLDFKGLPVNKIRHDIAAYVFLGIENTFCIALWPVFISVFVLSGSVYLQLGILSSLSVLAAIASAYTIGKMIDTRNARRVLRFSAIANAMLNLFRPFVGGPFSILAVNTVNEVLTTGYRLPFTKGFYAAADDLPGHRIVYIVSIEVIASICKGTAWTLIAILCGVIGPLYAIYAAFAIATLASLLIMTEQFKALDRKGV